MRNQFIYLVKITLYRHYDGIVLAYGAAGERKMGVPGEDDTQDCLSARRFVGWLAMQDSFKLIGTINRTCRYNGNPQDHDLKVDLQRGDTAVVVGNGNVALDVARILLTHIDVLRKTDIPEYVNFIQF